MDDRTPKGRDSAAASEDQTQTQAATPKTDWETPKMEAVSEQVTAQPYIRFT